MPYKATSISKRHRGWHTDQINGRLSAQFNGTEVFDFDANDLAIAVAATMALTLNVTGVATAAGGLVVTGTTTLGSGAIAYTWPAADGSNGNQLTTNGSGALSWAAASLGKYKIDLGPVSPDEALAMVMATPVHHFRYNPKTLPKGQWAPPHEMTGVFAEEAPWAMQGEKRDNFSAMNAFGQIMAAVQALGKRVEVLEAA